MESSVINLVHGGMVSIWPFSVGGADGGSVELHLQIWQEERGGTRRMVGKIVMRPEHWDSLMTQVPDIAEMISSHLAASSKIKKRE